MNLQIQLGGHTAARFDATLDRMGWMAGEPTQIREGWPRLSVNEWSPETDTAAQWLAGLFPEGLSREPFETRAARQERQPGAGEGIITLLWGNWDHEYAGAIEIVRDDKPRAPADWRPMSDDDVGVLIQRMTQERAERGRPRWPLEEGWRKSALAGMRGKIALRRMDNGWAIATGTGLSTWIVKHEDRTKLPGEAGTEAIMQRALAHIGVRTARTEARVFAGEQCVLSERSDRTEKGDTVAAVHQEDFLQASGWSARRKYEERVRDEPGYALLYRMLAENARDPDAEQAMLTRLIGACVMGGNADMHRKNIGLLHEEDSAQIRVKLAPVYDFGSWPGLERAVAGRGQAQGKLALSVNGIDEPSRIGMRQWMGMAVEARIDPDGVIEEVRAVGRTLPDAIAQAAREARETDENREQGWVDRRTHATVDYARRRARAFEGEIESRTRKGHGRKLRAIDTKRTQAWEKEMRTCGYPLYEFDDDTEGRTLTVVRCEGQGRETLGTGLTLSEIAKIECEDRKWPVEAQATVRRAAELEEARARTQVLPILR